MSRINRIAFRLVSQLEDLYVHGDNPYNDYRPEAKQWDFHHKVADLKKTKQNLERAFAARKIPIRIVYSDPTHLSAIPKRGVITFFYEPILEQEPPTSWMIIHNLAHGVFDRIKSDNPHSLYKKNQDYPLISEALIYGMQLSPNKYPEKETGKSDAIHPTTRSALNDMITSDIEAFYEIFTQWVVTGRVRLRSKNQDRAQLWERQLEKHFREMVDKIAAMGVVLHNV